jgi:hypothetical protein
VKEDDFLKWRRQSSTIAVQPLFPIFSREQLFIFRVRVRPRFFAMKIFQEIG